jgi:hypothetical protein
VAGQSAIDAPPTTPSALKLTDDESGQITEGGAVILHSIVPGSCRSLLPRVVSRVDEAESPRVEGGDLYNRLFIVEGIMR